MALSRRNILVGLGALVAGGGALVGTGAFTTVSAERTVDVNTAGDASAFLTIEGDGEYVTDDSSDGTLTIDLGGPNSEGFNQNGVTQLDGVVTITNNAADGSDATVGVSTTAPGSNPSASGSAAILIQDDQGNNVAEVTFLTSPGSDGESIASGSTQTISSGSSAELDVKVDTRTETLNNPSASAGESLTIVAE